MPTKSLSITVVRPDDLLVLRLDFLDVDFTPPQGGQPGRIAGQPQARLIVHFQPQHVAEQAFWEASDGTKQTPAEQAAEQTAPPPGNELPLPPPGSVQSRLAGPSRLAFTIPPGQSFPLTLEGVLEALTKLPLNVPPVAGYEPAFGCLLPTSWLQALGLPPPKITEPNRFQTAIEAPYRLFLSPDSQASWAHAAKPVERDGRTELWHTRLGTHRKSGDPRVRAVWSPDFIRNPQNHDILPFRMSLDKRDRNELVQLTSNYYLPGFTPTPVATERLMLTALGAWLDVEGRWEPPIIPADPPDVPAKRSLTVEQWRHLATMGRDHYVRVVYAGYLFPFGHRASLVKVTERKFAFRQDDHNPGFVAYNFQRMFILVREPERSYNQRDLPFRKVTIKTRVTPNLAKPEDSEVLPGKNQDAFWPRVAAGGAIADFPFHLVGTDWEGKQIEFNAPLIFVSKDIDETDASIQGVVNAYKAVPVADARRTRSLGGQRVAFAPSLKSGDTALEAATISFDGEKVPSAARRTSGPRWPRQAWTSPRSSNCSASPRFRRSSGSRPLFQASGKPSATRARFSPR